MQETFFNLTNPDETALSQSEMENKYLTFWSNSQLFGAPIADVVQIVGIQTITPMPEYPHYVKGIINLRGNVIPVLDIRLRFNNAEIPYNDRTCIIVVNIQNHSFGFLVDEVDEVATIESEYICPPPYTQAEISTTYLTGVARIPVENGGLDRIVLIIDAAKILGENNLALAGHEIEL